MEGHTEACMTLAFSSTGLACRSICTWCLVGPHGPVRPTSKQCQDPKLLNILDYLECNPIREQVVARPTRRTWPNQLAYEWTEGSEVSRGLRRQAVEWSRQPSSNCQRRTEKECLKAKKELVQHPANRRHCHYRERVTFRCTCAGKERSLQ